MMQRRLKEMHREWSLSMETDVSFSHFSIHIQIFSIWRAITELQSMRSYFRHAEHVKGLEGHKTLNFQYKIFKKWV